MWPRDHPSGPGTIYSFYVCAGADPDPAPLGTMQYEMHWNDKACFRELIRQST